MNFKKPPEAIKNDWFVVELLSFWTRFCIVVIGIGFFYPLIYFFQFLFWLLFPFSLWTFLFFFALDFYYPFSLWTFISLFSLDFYLPFFFGHLFSLFSLDFYSIVVTHFGFFQVFFHFWLNISTINFQSEFLRSFWFFWHLLNSW